jgi:plastocyanin
VLSWLLDKKGATMKRLFSLVSALLILSVVFAGCQRAENSPDNPQNNSGTSNNDVQLEISTDSESSFSEEAAEESRATTPGGATGGRVEVSTSQSQKSSGGTASSEQSTTVKLDASDFAYSVKKITASADSELVLEVTNVQGVHDFVIDELGVSSGRLPVGKTVRLQIPTDKPGSYQYYCSVGNHRELGMVGTLVIR